MFFIGLLLLSCVENLVKGHPLQHLLHDASIKPESPTIFVNVTSFQRGTHPLLIPKNYSHILPFKFMASENASGYQNTNKPNASSELSYEQSIISLFTCSNCKAGIYFLKSYASRTKSTNDLTTLKEICINFNMFPVDVCNGLIHRFGPEIIFVLNHSNFDVNEYCATIIANDDCMGSGKSINTNWEISLPLISKPVPKALQLPLDSFPTFKVLHITDTHYDPLYMEGANAVCKEPLCCRDTTQTVLKPSDGAGKWGDYRNCDLPKVTIDHMFNSIGQQHPDIDYILWTGDIQPHNIWSDTKEQNLKLLREVVASMKDIFKNIPIFPAIGNHEATPSSSFPPPFVTESEFVDNWLLDEIDVQWRNWLPENALPTIKYGGFYSVLVRPGFRIISLNTNYCYSVNFWLLMNATDPASELQWLVYELQAAELANEKVHIIGHIPPGYADCMRIWSRNYYEIIARYESTVTAQFFGHTHGDEIEVFYDPDDLNRATNVLFIAPSVTPYANFNPGYKIYYVDGDHADTSRMVIDEEAWSFNLEDANVRGESPNWYKLYSARSSYAMDGLRPSDWNDFINKMRNNEEMFDLYYKHYWRDSPKRPNCNAKCKKELICDARSGRSHDRKVLCEDIITNNKEKYLSY